MEGELPDEEFGRLLVATNFTEGNGSRPEAMWLLYASGSRLIMIQCEDGIGVDVTYLGSLTGGLGGKLFARSFTSGGLPGGLLLKGMVRIIVN